MTRVSAVDPEWEWQVRDFIRQRRREYAEHALDYREEQDMELKVQAPQNPYRQALGDELSEGTFSTFGTGEPGPRSFDGNSGPGLSGDDLNRMVRQHFRDGFAAGQRHMRPYIESLESGQEGIYDEGYAAGRVERARELASSLYMALRTERLEHPLYRPDMAPKMTRAQLRASADDFGEKVDAVLDELRRVVAGEHDAFILAGDEETIVR